MTLEREGTNTCPNQHKNQARALVSSPLFSSSSFFYLYIFIASFGRLLLCTALKTSAQRTYSVLEH